MGSVHPFSLQQLYKVYRGFLSMEACAAGYALITSQNQSYVTTGGLLPISSSWRQAP
jgi:hypothetical protein